MENKSTDANALTPEGERMLNARLVEMDLNKFITELKQKLNGENVTVIPSLY